MGLLATSAFAGTNSYQGALAYSAFNAQGTPVGLPTGVVGMNRRPSMLSFNRRRYVIGQFSRPLVWTERRQVWPMGIRPPASAPTVIASGVATGIVGQGYGVFTYAQKYGSTIVCESNPSSQSTLLTLNNQGRQWTFPAATNVDPRATHIRAYWSQSGDIPRSVFDVPITATVVTESTATLSRGSQIDNDGTTIVTDHFGVPPYTLYGEIYHDRMWLGNDPRYPYRVWFTATHNIEGCGLGDYFDTRDREHVTALKRHRDELLIFSRRTCYSVQGWQASDFTIRRLSPSIGCISQAAIVNIHDRLWFPAEDGVYMYDGGFHYMMDDLRDYWRDQYRQFPGNFHDSFAADDRLRHAYKLGIREYSGTGTRYFLGWYSYVEPEEGGSMTQPDWSFDFRNRNDSVEFSYDDPNTGTHLYTGSCDGKVREENNYSDLTDDGDTYNMQYTVQTGVLSMGEPAGDEEEGKNFEAVWVYLESENNSWTFTALGGDESTVFASTPDNITKFFTRTLPAGALANFTAKTIWPLVLERVSGRGVIFKIVAANPNNMVYRGIGGKYVPGKATRASTT